jgi:hypothetical protein
MQEAAAGRAMAVRGKSGARRCCVYTCVRASVRYPVQVSIPSARIHGVHTFCFACGRSGIYATGWKLKGFRTFSDPLIEGASESVMPLTALAGVYGKVALAGVKMVVGVARCDTESLGPRVAYCLDGNVADMGERALWPNRNGPGDSSLSNPSPCGRGGWGGALSSRGGVGVRGGSGTGIFEAMAAIDEQW